ncbi:MAG: 3D domain-containing protein [Armatimonadota bacterium]
MAIVPALVAGVLIVSTAATARRTAALVPLRATLEPRGYRVGYDANTGQAIVTNPRTGKAVRFKGTTVGGTMYATQSQINSIVAQLGPPTVPVLRGYIRPTKVLRVEATAYCLPGRTRMGTPVRKGVVAVDPKVIPLGSVLYVEGYGWGRAEDTGAAIKGNRIDVWLPTRKEALEWGRKTVTVYVYPKTA